MQRAAEIGPEIAESVEKDVVRDSDVSVDT